MKWSKGRAAYIYTCTAIASAAWTVCMIKLVRLIF